MVNTEILGGLKHALNRGESLEKTMTSFYNAGYRKEEIEEVARFIKQEEAPLSVSQEKKLMPVQLKPQSKISSYGQEKPKSNQVKKAGKWLLTAIILAAILFVGLLIVFLVAT